MQYEVTIRRRRPSDIPELVDVLLAQQPETRYPFKDPLPIPIEDFLHASDATKAWTAELDGRPVGHVCRTGPASGFAAADLLDDICAEAHSCEPSALSWINAFFVDTAARRQGIGRRLLEAARDDAFGDGLHPCLEVLPMHPAALSLYLATGWRVVHRFRPDWLRGVLGEDGPDVHVLAFVGVEVPG